MTTKTFAWIGLVLGFLLMTGVLNMNTILRIAGFIILLIALIVIIRDK